MTNAQRVDADRGNLIIYWTEREELIKIKRGVIERARLKRILRIKEANGFESQIRKIEGENET